MRVLLGPLAKLDRNVRSVLIYRIWTILAGVITVIFIPHYLTANVQGYYYTFLSIVALQVLFDLGLSQTVAQVSSHEFAHVDGDGLNEFHANARVGKLAYIKTVITAWYAWVSGLFVVGVISFGTVYFLYFSKGFDESWLGPWIALVASTGINLFLSPKLAMVEGAGWTGAVADLRLLQSIIGYGLLVGSVVVGSQLWCIIAVPITANLCSFLWLKFADNPYRSVPTFISDIHDHLPWRREILGLQWRVAIAWLGGYFASQIIVPVVFALQGAAEAGKIGLGLQIFTAVQALGMSWISARIPLFGRLISQGDQHALQRQFRKAAIYATVASGLFGLAVGIVLEAARVAGFTLTNRIPSTPAIAALILISTLGTAIYALAAYMRAHKVEPLVASSLVIGATTFVGAVTFGHMGSDEVVFVYAAVTVFINLPWTLIIFCKYYGRELAR